MIYPILLLCSIVFYQIFEGITEATVFQRIYGHVPIDAGDYHFYRLLEGVGIVSFGVCVYPCAVRLYPWEFAVLLTGAWLIGWTAYEGAYTLRSGAGFWVKTSPWKLNVFGWRVEIQFRRWMYCVALVVGCALVWKVLT